MSELNLYMAPHSCSRVLLVVLEEIGVDYDITPARLMRGEHHAPNYLKLNPKGQVPTLAIDGAFLSETSSVIMYLNSRFPEAELMPVAKTPLELAQQYTDLSMCGGTLHSLVARIRVPHIIAGGQIGVQGVHDRGIERIRQHADAIEARLAKAPWWYGDTWSGVDAFLYWVFWRIHDGGFPNELYPAITAHRSRLEARPATIRALARELAVEAEMVADGSAFVSFAGGAAGKA